MVKTEQNWQSTLVQLLVRSSFDQFQPVFKLLNEPFKGTSY